MIFWDSVSSHILCFSVKYYCGKPTTNYNIVSEMEVTGEKIRGLIILEHITQVFPCDQKKKKKSIFLGNKSK